MAARSGTEVPVRHQRAGGRAGAATARWGPRARENIAGYAFLLPWFTGLIVIVAGPLIASLVLSFTDYNASGTPRFTGISNYSRALTNDPQFWSAVKVTLTYVAVSVPLVVCVALGLAVLLDKGVRGLAIYRATLYLPTLMGGSVAIALLWQHIFGATGLVNYALGVIGIHTTISWVGTPGTALYTLVALHLWAFGSTMIIFLAGLRQIPQSLYEAAELDGAGAWRRFVHITLPTLSPLILFGTVLNTIFAFQAFNSAYVVSNGTGGPADSTLFYTLYIYQRGFVDFNLGYASALGWILIVGIAVAAALIFRLSRRWIFYGDQS